VETNVVMMGGGAGGRGECHQGGDTDKDDNRNLAILPFTSALSAFCAAATAATVELPILDTISSLYGVVGEIAVLSTFPILSSAFAAAAAVSKARCEVDAEGAAQVTSTLALEYDDMNGGSDDPVLRPFQAVRELVRLAVTSGLRSFKRSNPFGKIWRIGRRAMAQWRKQMNRMTSREEEWIERGVSLA
jgi:hypothetical protein